MYSIKFISEKDFTSHVKNTINEYIESLKPYNLKEFNSNIIDPIKLMFDKNVMNKTYDEIIDDEIKRQKDKTDNNSIGYFHQNIFKYIKNCEVPKHYWDIIYHGDKNYYVELKNKHNTMNSTSSQKTYIKLQSKIIEEPNSIACLVEVIAKKSQNIPWKCTVDKRKMCNNSIRRISIDQFYKLVTNEDDAFLQICKQLPETISKLIKNKELSFEKDTVIDELKEINPNILKALYYLAFNTYLGFDELNLKK